MSVYLDGACPAENTHVASLPPMKPIDISSTESLRLRNYPVKFGLRLLRLRRRLLAARPERRQVPADVNPQEIFASATFGDLWLDAGMPECLMYLKGSTSLEIPSQWRELLPAAL